MYASVFFIPAPQRCTNKETRTHFSTDLHPKVAPEYIPPCNKNIWSTLSCKELVGELYCRIQYCKHWSSSFYETLVCFQMPEEQAFCVLVKIMYDYGLRALYRNNFEDLHCKFYQLERLMQVQNLSLPPPQCLLPLRGVSPWARRACGRLLRIGIRSDPID